MTNIVRLPDLHQSYYNARRLLHQPGLTRDEIVAALDVLEHSPDWEDMFLCREMRKLLAREPMPAMPAHEPRRMITIDSVAIAASIAWVLALMIVVWK